MYLDNSYISKPDNKDIKIWRYLDIPKFLSIIDNRGLFFSRAEYLGDPFEGSITQSKDQINLNKHFNRISNVMYSDDGTAHEWYSDHYFFRNSAYICCFHMNPIESTAMWSIYAKDNKGIAIQSTFNRLCNCFHVDHENTENIGVVKYLDDYSPDSSETIDVLKWATLPLLHKRKNFEHERELRAIIPFPHCVFPNGGELTKEILDSFPKGLSIPVDLDILIEKIYLAPSSSPWIIDLLNSVLKKYEINKKILPSALDQSPII